MYDISYCSSCCFPVLFYEILQALQCCVAGVTAITSSWTGECCIALRQLVAGKTLTFTVVDVLNNNSVFAVDAPLSTLGRAALLMKMKYSAIGCQFILKYKYMGLIVS